MKQNMSAADLELALRDHYVAMGVGSSRNLTNYVTEALNRAPTRRWHLPEIRLPRRVAAGAALAAACVAVAALVVGPLRFGPVVPAGPTGAIPSSTLSPSGTAVPTPSITPGMATPNLSGLAPNRASALGRLRSGGAWAAQGAALCTMPGTSIQTTCQTPWPASDLILPATYVLDAKHAWSVTLAPGTVNPNPSFAPPFDHQRVVVNRTSDGGVTWQKADVPGDYPGSTFALSFVDPEHGFIVTSPYQSLQLPSSTVLATSDGGATWSVVTASIPDNPVLGDALAVSDASTLWVAGGTSYRSPLLAVSRDGGRSWTEVALPGLGAQGSDQLASRSVAFVDSSTGFVTVQTGSDSRVFGTTDGGRNWTRENMPARFGVLDGAYTSNGLDVTDYVDADHWVASVGATFQSTADGGKTWQPAANAGLPRGVFIGLAFQDATHGFGLFQPYQAPLGTDQYMLYGTYNGGDYWWPVDGAQP